MTCGKTKARDLSVNVLGELIIFVVPLQKQLSHKKTRKYSIFILRKILCLILTFFFTKKLL